MTLQSLDEKELQRLFEREHLIFKGSNDDINGKKGDINFTFSEKQNLVIGPNGGGKTRFLKMIHQYYASTLEDPENVIVHLDFPEFERNDNRINDNKVYKFQKKMYDLIKDGFDCSLDEIMYKIKNSLNSFFLTLEYYTKLEDNEYEKMYHGNFIAKLNDFLEDLLSMRLEIIEEGGERDLKIIHYGQPIAQEKNINSGIKVYLTHMSPGEKNLFYVVLFLCCFLYFSEKKQLVIIMDEPELHLHSEKVIKLIQLLRKNFIEKTVTFWIATHSIQLLSEFQFEEVVLLEKGQLKPRNSGYFKTIFEAMQGKDPNLKLLLTSVENWEYYNFVRECFERPKTVIDKNKQDPQYIAFINQIKCFDNKKSIKVLDYGSGAGRFGYYLEDQEKIMYYTYDIFCSKPKQSIRHFQEYKALYNSGEKFSCILLVNTLHEIDISEWIDIFKLFEKVLDTDGFLFFCEAAVLSEGEFPYSDCGYLVLGMNEIQILFGDEVISVEFDKKIFSAAITQSQLEEFVKCKSDTQKRKLIEAMDVLSRSSYEKVEELFFHESRATEKNRRMLDEKEEKEKRIYARKYGFYSQQHINAKMAKSKLEASLEIYKKENKKNNSVLSIENLEYNIKSKIELLSSSMMVRFAWICAVRTLPMLFGTGKIDFWHESVRQNYLYSILFALDSASYNSDIINIAAVNNAGDAAIEAARNSNDRATSDAAFAAARVAFGACAAADTVVRTKNSSRVIVTNATASARATAHIDTINAVLTTIYAARAAASGSKIDKLKFSNTLINDLQCCQSDKLENLINSTTVYDKVWTNFHKTLVELGCDYWSRLYIKIFNDKFRLDIDELERRMNIPERIRLQGAAVVGQYLSKK
ncbi:MAG: ATP-binding protein [Lachnospiraceae bacterium]|jgi:energy-coupling factor transporter ATP-binding protein EcfA2|nr:ATP-binding protein [Lachnospiraceae bacterium]